MKILTDTEIIEVVDETKPNCIVKGVKKQLDWFSKNSPVQPTSLDLTIGKILLPGSSNNKKGSLKKPLQSLVLKQGHTAVILSKEELCFPSHIAGIGFPPSRLAIKGLLMTNPGLVDPGSVGNLHFTIINMGKKDITLRTGDVIFSLMIIELHEKVGKNIKERSNGPVSYHVNDQLDKLSHDFMDIEARALEIAKKEVQREGLKALILPPLFAAILVAIASWFSIFSPFQEKFNKIEKDVAVIKQQINYQEIKERLNKLENKLENENSKIKIEKNK